MIPESKPGKTEHGLLPKGDGWFVLNMRDAVWRHADGRGAVCLVLDDFENAPQAEQLGVNPFVLNPGEPMSMYHWEADQEDLLVVSGEAVLIIEGGAATACMGLRALPAQDEARDRRGRNRTVPRDRSGRAWALSRAGLARLPRRRSRQALRSERGGGHDGRRRGVRVSSKPRADRVSRWLASRVALALRTRR